MEYRIQLLEQRGYEITTDSSAQDVEELLDDFIEMWNNSSDMDVMTEKELALQKAAMAAEQSGDLEDAYDIWRTISSIDTNRPDYLCILERVAQKLGRWAYAEQAFLDAIKVASKLKAILVS